MLKFYHVGTKDKEMAGLFRVFWSPLVVCIILGTHADIPDFDDFSSRSVRDLRNTTIENDQDQGHRSDSSKNRRHRNEHDNRAMNRNDDGDYSVITEDIRCLPLTIYPMAAPSNEIGHTAIKTASQEASTVSGTTNTN